MANTIIKNGVCLTLRIYIYIYIYILLYIMWLMIIDPEMQKGHVCYKKM